MGACNAKDISKNKDVEEEMGADLIVGKNTKQKPIKKNIVKNSQNDIQQQKQQQNQELDKNQIDKQQQVQNEDQNQTKSQEYQSRKVQEFFGNNFSEIKERNLESEVDVDGMMISQVQMEIQNEEDLMNNLVNLKNQEIYKQYWEQLKQINESRLWFNYQEISQSEQVKQLHVKFQQSKIYEKVLQQKNLLRDQENQKYLNKVQSQENTNELINLSYANKLIQYIFEHPDPQYIILIQKILTEKKDNDKTTIHLLPEQSEEENVYFIQKLQKIIGENDLNKQEIVIKQRKKRTLPKFKLQELTESLLQIQDGVIKIYN